MRKLLLSAAAAASLLAMPAFAQTVGNLPYGSDEPQAQAQWDALVGQANAYRSAHQPQTQALGDVASVKGVTATDAAQGAARAAQQPFAFPSHYHSALEIKQDR